MKLVDLSHTTISNMPDFPQEKFATFFKIAKQRKPIAGYVNENMHIGTHIDAPYHFNINGKKISELPLDLFRGKARLIDATNQLKLDTDLIAGMELDPGDIILFYTGHDKKFGTPEYFENYPVMTKDLAHELIKCKIKMIGFDTPSPDIDPFPIHQILFEHGILILENLTNLEQLVGKQNIDLIAYPPKIFSDAAPVRVVAFCEAN